MKLKKIKVFVVGNPPPHFGGRYRIFVKLIGVELNEKVASKYSYTGTKLHLEMGSI